jgi:ribonuclease E
MKRMLINATQAEERRLAVVDGQKLLDFETEVEGREQRKGNIYKAVVTRVEPSLEACFVDYGEDRHGFLPFKEISRQYFPSGASVSQARIQDVIKEGQSLVIQVEKEERGNKGAALTTFISLAGRYVVLMPNNPRGGGVSRRIEGEERQELKAALDQLEYPKGMSIIARTAGIGRAADELQWDLNYLLKLWTAIDSATGAPGAFLIYQESSLVIRAIRDYYNSDIGEILIDTDDLYEQAHQFMNHVMPDQGSRVKRYRDEAPLFSRFQIEHQIESAYARTVHLPSGGAIVIDHTEALVSVDVNSARSIKGGAIEETATRTNIEAAEEVARQARLRDLGGLIVIDFIDMDEAKNRREVENCLRDALRPDRARVQLGTISKFGLLEMSRQRLRPALNEGASIPCPRCGGSGHIRDTESSALQILRVIQEESMKDNTAAVLVQVPVEVASFLLNEKRTEITKIELQQRIHILMVPNKSLDTPNYKLERLKHDDPRLDNLQASYTLAEETEDPTAVTRRSQEPTNKQVPIIKGVLPDAPAPRAEPKPPVADKPTPAARQPKAVAAVSAPATGGFFGWIKRLLGLDGAADASNTSTTPAPAARQERGERNDRAPRNGERRNGDRRRGGRGERNARDDAEGNRPENARADGGRQRAGERTSERPGERSNERNSERSAGRTGERRGERRGERSNGTTDAPTDNAERQDSNTALEANADGKARRPRRERGPRRRNGEEGTMARTDDGLNDAADIAQVTTASAVNEAPSYSYFAAGAAPAASADTAVVSNAVPNEQEATEGQSPEARPQRERRSRDRYGRDRRRREDGGTEQADAQEQAAPSDDAPVETTPAAPEVHADTQPAPAQPEAAVMATPATESSPPAAADVVHATAPTPVAQAAETSGMKRAQAFALPIADLSAMAAAAGMQWINSDADKIAAAQAAIAAEPAPVHVPRERAPAVISDEGPLILVETRRDLSGMALPFETSASAPHA